MGNRIKGFRFSGEYEDVFEYPNNGEYIYICADPWAWGYSFTATDYRSNGDGTYSCGSTYPVSIDQIADELVPGYQAPMNVAAVIVGAEFARAYYFEGDESDLEEWALTICDVSSLMDVAACHVLDTPSAPDVFEPADGESYSDFYGKWRKAFKASGMDAVC